MFIRSAGIGEAFNPFEDGTAIESPYNTPNIGDFYKPYNSMLEADPYNLDPELDADKIKDTDQDKNPAFLQSLKVERADVILFLGLVAGAALIAKLK